MAEIFLLTDLIFSTPLYPSLPRDHPALSLGPPPASVGAGSALERVARVVNAKESNVCAVCAPVQRAALVAALNQDAAATTQANRDQAAAGAGALDANCAGASVASPGGSASAATTATTVGGAGFGAASGGRVREASSIAEVFDHVMTAW